MPSCRRGLPFDEHDGLVAVGLYGVVAHAVTLRTREIGVRMALGASRSSVVGHVVGNALLLVAIGIVARDRGSLCRDRRFNGSPDRAAEGSLRR